MDTKRDFPPLPDGFTYRLDLIRAATPRLLKNRRIHRWFYFPHSYSPELVETILEYWRLSKDSWLLDPFVGAGTTLVCAQYKGMNAIGIDKSPLAVRVSNAKCAHYDAHTLMQALEVIRRKSNKMAYPLKPPCERLARAFSPREYGVLHSIRDGINLLDEPYAGFFWLALLTTAKHFSRAVANGGWFRWIDKPDRGTEVFERFEQTTQEMLSDLEKIEGELGTICQAHIGDAREVHNLRIRFDSVITSPPYPNRHDYTRIYHVELLLMGYSEEEITNIRHSSLRAHVEARPPTGLTTDVSGDMAYRMPQTLVRELGNLPENTEARVITMLKGYFHDLFNSIASSTETLRSGGRIAFVVGNVRHNGVMFHVDEILAELGQQLGLLWQGTWVIRLRGNSAQQMGRFGKEPARESIVFFQKPFEKSGVGLKPG